MILVTRVTVTVGGGGEGDGSSIIAWSLVELMLWEKVTAAAVVDSLPALTLLTLNVSNSQARIIKTFHRRWSDGSEADRGDSDDLVFVFGLVEVFGLLEAVGSPFLCCCCCSCS